MITEVEKIDAATRRSEGPRRASAWLKRRIFGIAEDETTCARRGFQVDTPEIRRHLEQIGRSFVAGYHAGLEGRHAADVAERLSDLEHAYRGFAFEGAAMSLALLDGLAPWTSRLIPFLTGPGAPHSYMVCVGAGWAPARVGLLSINALMRRLPPDLRWLAMDGYGFHAGYFHWSSSVDRQRRPRGLRGYSPRAFDQGLGRSLWFVKGADVERIAVAIESFPEQRRDDLYSGAALACAYAGGRDEESVRRFASAAGERRRPLLAQGAAFGAQARHRAGNPMGHTDMACAILCGRSAEEAARITQDVVRDVPSEEDLWTGTPFYEVWRRRIHQAFAAV